MGGCSGRQLYTSLVLRRGRKLSHVKVPASFGRCGCRRKALVANYFLLTWNQIEQDSWIIIKFTQPRTLLPPETLLTLTWDFFPLHIAVDMYGRNFMQAFKVPQNSSTGNISVIFTFTLHLLYLKSLCTSHHWSTRVYTDGKLVLQLIT